MRNYCELQKTNFCLGCEIYDVPKYNEENKIPGIELPPVIQNMTFPMLVPVWKRKFGTVGEKYDLIERHNVQFVDMEKAGNGLLVVGKEEDDEFGFLANVCLPSSFGEKYLKKSDYFSKKLDNKN